MKILIDQNENLISAKKSFNPESILSNIESTLHSSGKIITSFTFNGQPFEFEDLQNKFTASAPLASDVLEITTAELKDHLSTLLDAIARGLDDAEEQAVTIADRYLERNNKASLENLTDWSNNILGLVANIQTFIAIFNVDISDIKIGKQKFEAGLENINKFLTEVNNAMESGDKTRVSDIMEFELAGLIRDLKDILPNLKERMTVVLESAH